MNLRYITCSDLRENVPHESAINLLRISDKVELGIQVHPTAMSAGMPRNIWFNELMLKSEKEKTPLNIAMHINYQWCSDFCRGIISGELVHWLTMCNKNGTKLIRRLQLNIGDKTNGFNAHALANLISWRPDCEFIFPYNEKESVKTAISDLKRTGAKFSLLYDSSYGYGITPDSWSPPAFSDIPQGYAGGLSPENVYSNLTEISKQVPRGYETWIDAEGKLMKPDTREFDVKRAYSYIDSALDWLVDNRQR